MLSWLRRAAASDVNELSESEFIKKFLSESENFKALKRLYNDKFVLPAQMEFINNIEKTNNFLELIGVLSTWDITFNPIKICGISTLLCKDPKVNQINSFQYYAASLVEEAQLQAQIYEFRKKCNV